MHTYSTDNHLRPKVIGGLGVLSYLIVLALGDVVTILNELLNLNLNISVLMTGMVFTGLYLLFSLYFWNIWAFRRLGIVKIPDLSGEWAGYIQSSYWEEEDAEGRNEVEVQIRQSWRKISIELSSPDSSSRSLGATILAKQGKPQLTYHYLSEPDYNAPDTMSIHYGTASLTFHASEDEEDADVLQGDYYTSADRDSHGKLHLSREN